MNFAVIKTLNIYIEHLTQGVRPQVKLDRKLLYSVGNKLYNFEKVTIVVYEDGSVKITVFMNGPCAEV